MEEERAARHERFTHAIGKVIVLIVFVVGSPISLCEVRFEPLPLRISGLPDDMSVHACITADIEGLGRPDVIIAGTWLTHEAAFVIREKGGNLAVVSRLFEDETVGPEVGLQAAGRPASGAIYVPRIQRLSKCDLDNDGRQELFALGFEPEWHRMASSTAQGLLEMPAPFPRVGSPVMAWLDYDADGWTDLFLAGTEPDPSKPDWASSATPRIYRNQRGCLTATDITFDVREPVDAAHVLDFNEDGRPDLLLGTAVGSAGATRIFLNRGGTFVELQRPLKGIDQLDGLRSASVATADLDGDGLADLLLSGLSHPSLGLKSCISVVYRKYRVDGTDRYLLEYDLPRTRSMPDIWGELHVADLDSDGDPDVFTFGRNRQHEPAAVFLENESGRLCRVSCDWPSKTSAAALDPLWGLSVAFLDINNDGMVDLACFPGGAGARPFLLLNRSR